jgi:hypothetical protein
MKNLTEHQITTALGRVERGLSLYLWLQNRVGLCDVSKDEEFQKCFVALYRVRRNSKWQSSYFGLLEIAKFKSMNFPVVLRELNRLTGSIEASFASKLVASLDPSMPVIDKFVLECFGLRLPRWGLPDRELKTIDIYQNLCDRYCDLMQNPTGTLIRELFDRKYPGCTVSELKKIDLVLWQIRS